MPAGAANWTNTDRLYGNAERIYGTSAAKEYTVPCEGGTQRWQNVSPQASCFTREKAARLLPEKKFVQSSPAILLGWPACLAPLGHGA